MVWRPALLVAACLGVFAGTACGSSEHDSGAHGGASATGSSGRASGGSGAGAAGRAAPASGGTSGAGTSGGRGASGGTAGSAGSGGQSASSGFGATDAGSGGETAAGGSGDGGEGGRAPEPVVCTGDFAITTQESYADFVARRCEIVTGNLAIVGIAGLTDLTGLESLRAVEGNTSFSYNPDLGSLVGARNLARTKVLMLESDDVLTTPIGLDSLESVEQLLVEDDPHFTNFTGLDRLKSVTVLFDVERLPAFEGFEGLTALESVKGLLVNDCPSLVDFHGLEGLSELSMLANRDASLASFTGFENLVQGGFQIADCPALVDISDLAQLTRASFLNFRNVGLSSLHGVENVESADYLQLWNDEKLVDLGALAKLKEVGNNVQIVQNPLLKSLAGFEALEHIEFGLFIQENPELAELNFDALLSCGSAFEIFSNPKLPQCAVDGLLTQLGMTCPMYCKDNDAGGVCG
jgi:hypothetical protein